MALRFKLQYLIGIFVGITIIIFDFYLSYVEGYKRFFIPLIILGISIGWIQFWIDFFKENKRQDEIELKFLEFSRNLVSNVKSGVTIPKAIVNVSDEDYGSLTPFVKKLSRQVDWGIPIHKALTTFANDTENKVIKRAIAIIIEADESGGDIVEILQSVALSIINIKKMRQERRSNVYSQIVQGYIVFFVFIGVMLILELFLFPKLAIAGIGGIGENLEAVGLMSGIGGGTPLDLDFVFFSLILIQGFFAGIMVGKFSEGSIKHGLVHSVILMTIGVLIITIAKGGI